MCGGVLIALVVVGLGANQIVTGLAFTILAGAATSYIYQHSFSIGQNPPPHRAHRHAAADRAHARRARCGDRPDARHGRRPRRVGGRRVAGGRRRPRLRRPSHPLPGDDRRLVARRARRRGAGLRAARAVHPERHRRARLGGPGARRVRRVAAAAVRARSAAVRAVRRRAAAPPGHQHGHPLRGVPRPPVRRDARRPGAARPQQPHARRPSACRSTAASRDGGRRVPRGDGRGRRRHADAGARPSSAPRRRRRRPSTRPAPSRGRSPRLARRRPPSSPRRAPS